MPLLLMVVPGNGGSDEFAGSCTLSGLVVNETPACDRHCRMDFDVQLKVAS